MKATHTLSLAALLAGATLLAACNSNANTSTTPQASSAPNCPGTNAFTQQAIVFDAITICATAEVPREKLSYAANVAAEWLDNDGDGNADEPRVVDAIKNNNAVLVMTKSGPTNQLMSALEGAISSGIFQDLSAEETNPSGGRRDASQEEIHHLILNAGWAKFLPNTFGDQKGSKLYAQWELAEKQGHYSYNDFTCDAACKVTEFFYLATAAYLGSDADLYSDEMRLKNRSQLQNALPETVSIIQSNAYVYPKDHWPRGVYAHQKNIRFTP